MSSVERGVQATRSWREAWMGRPWEGRGWMGGGADKVGRTKDACGRGRFEVHGFAWRNRGRGVGMQGKGKPDLFGA